MSDSKRRRLAKTSQNQYEEYLRLIEEAEFFRTGTINPTMDANYINNCWKNLAIRLNACGNGPRKKLDRWWFFVSNSAESSGGERNFCLGPGYSHWHNKCLYIWRIPSRNSQRISLWG
ncbi:hypothetical protein MTP99_002918 [Tenebrio molitor]|nr:hypothetical protein MTP99_002918 [Tenebrio molitor]